MTPTRFARALGRRARSLGALLAFALREPVELAVTAYNNLERDGADPKRFAGTLADPQIYFEGLPGPGARGSARVEFDLAVLGNDSLHRPVLYFRRSGMFDEADRVSVARFGAQRLCAFIPNLADLDGLRFDPSEGPCDIRLTAVRLYRADAAPEVPPEYIETDPGTPAPDIQRLAAHTALKNVQLVGAEGIEPAGEPGQFTLSGPDPQLVLTLSPSAFADGALLTRLTFKIGPMQAPLSAPRLYVDYVGEGFSESKSLALAAQDDGLVALIALPHLVERIRWDPADRGGQSLPLETIEAWPERLAPLEKGEEEGEPDERAAWGDIALELTASLNARHFNGGVALGYDYARWLAAYETPGAKDYARMREMMGSFTSRPSFSFVMPTYNPPPSLLEACIRSMQAQNYPDFEICIADDCSTNPEVRLTLQRLADLDPRIRLTFRETNGHISRASNSALELATGDFVVLVDHDDLLPDYALFVVAEALQRRPDAKIVYSDEDKLGPDGKRCDPYFKSEFNEFLMYGHNMVSHLGVYDRKLVETVGGFRTGYEGSQDYDLFLRCAELCEPKQIVHIPHVLYHWRILPGSTALAADQKDYAIVAARKAINSAFRRRGLPFKSAPGVAPGLTSIQTLGTPQIPVSIVIPTRDGLKLLKPCLASLEPLDPQTEIVIVDNGSVEPATLAFLSEFARLPNRKVVRDDGGFNFSRLCNLGVAQSSGSIICLLNNDTELLSPGWLSRACTLLSQETVGAVGARLVYPDGTLQHFGLVLGMGGHGIAGTPHRGIPMDSFGSFGKARLLQEFSAVTAACLFVRKADYMAVGGFDTDLAVAYNDVDFCLKLRARGLKVLADPEILLTHKESKTRGSDGEGEQAQRLATEALIVQQRWGDELRKDPYYSPNLTLLRDDLSLAERPRQPWPWAPNQDAGN